MTIFNDDKKRMLRDFVLALSLANLGFYKLWRELFFRPVPAEKFFIKFLPGPLHFTAALFDIVLMALVFWAGIQLARRSKSLFLLRTAQLLFVLTVIFFTGHILLVHLGPYLSNMAHNKRMIIMDGLAPVTIVLFALFFRRFYCSTVTFCAILVLAFAPFVLVTFTRAGLRIFTPDFMPVFMDQPLAKPFPTVKGSPHVVLLLFDGMDERLCFAARPPALRYPELDRFCREAFYAENAYPPGNCTDLSLPSFTIGKRVVNSHPVDSNRMKLLLEGSPDEVYWNGLPNLFSKTRDLGLNTALVGWHLPYGRVFGSSLNYFYWATGEIPRIARNQTFETATLDCLKRVLPLQHKRDHINEYLNILEHAKKIVSNPAYNLAMVHWPVPHAPQIYDYKRRQFTYFASSITGYFGNVALADDALGEVRRRMERDGAWDDAAVLIFSDHHWLNSWMYDGGNDARSVFMLKLPHQSKPVVYSRQFNTVLIHHLTLALLRREIVTPEQLVAWLDKNRS